jgi:hypothetical protein
MNMYSDEKGSAIWYIEDHLEVFLDLGYVGGDVNCPSSHWDATILHKHPMATRLMECTTSLNMERVAPPLGWVTHLLYNVVLHGLILDLVFLLIYWGYLANLTIGDKGEPNHFPLLLDVPLKVFWPEGKMSIKANSEEEADFLGKVIISVRLQSQISCLWIKPRLLLRQYPRFLTWHGPIMLRLSGLAPALSLGGIQTVIGPRPLQ